jgi:hypothetical protein
MDSQFLVTSHAVYYSFVKIEWHCGENEDGKKTPKRI